MKVVLLVCAESTLLDANSNRVSLINVYDEISSPQFPFLTPLFSVLAVTQKDDDEEDECSCNVRISLDDNEIFVAPVLINYQGTELHRTIIGLQGLVISGPGTLKIQLLFDGAEIGDWNIPVKQLAPSMVVNGQQA